MPSSPLSAQTSPAPNASSKTFSLAFKNVENETKDSIIARARARVAAAHAGIARAEDTLEDAHAKAHADVIRADKTLDAAWAELRISRSDLALVEVGG